MYSMLYVDDHKNELIVFKQCMKEYINNYAIVHCLTLTESLKALEEQKFDIILLDLFLPHSSGIETIKLMKKYSADIPIIVYCYLDDERFIAEVLNEGAADFIVKQVYDGSYLHNRIMKVINSRYLTPPFIDKVE